MPDRIKFVGREEFAKAAKDGPVEGETLALRKAFPSVVRAFDVDARTIDFLISNAAVDRMNDSIAVDGWDFDAYMRSPVVLWAHDSSAPPVAKALSVTKTKDALLSTAKFMDADLSPFANSVFRMYQEGYLSAVSVGFVPKEMEFSRDKDRQYGIDFIKQELLEYSCCPVPANPEALIAARAKGIDTAPLREWAEKVLDEGGCVMVPRDLLEETFRQAKTPRSVRQKYLAKSESADWKVGAARDLAIDDSDAWDGPAAAKRMLDDAGFDGDSPNVEKAKRGFLIHDAANPKLRGSYKLPFADMVGGSLKAVKGGIHAAASRLPQTDAPQTILNEARTVLDAYEKRLGNPDKAMSDDDTPTGSCGREKGDECGMKDPAECMIHCDMEDAMKAAPRRKAGRKISAANEALLRKAMEHHESATKCIKDVLDSNDPDGDEAGGEGDDPDGDGDDPYKGMTAEERRKAERLAEARALKDKLKS